MSAALEIDVHLVDGSVHSFRQADAAKAKTVLSRLHPDRVFSGEVLVLAGADRVVTARCRAVLRIEVRGAVPEDWGFGPGFDSIELSEPGLRLDQPAQFPAVGQPYAVPLEVRDAAGGTRTMVVRGQVRPEAVRVHRLERLLDGRCMHVKTPDGALLIHLANVSALTVFGTVSLPPHALDVEPEPC